MENVIKKREIPLVHNSIDENEISKLVEWLSQKPTPQLTKGIQTLALEQKWSKMIGAKYSCFVNSGSSALLLALHVLLESKKIERGSKCLIPSLSWSTDLSSAYILGLEPVMVDCNMSDLSVDIEHLKNIIEKEKPSVLLLVSVLGLSPQMDEIIKICDAYGVFIIEDCCESLKSKYNDKNLGTFGLMSCFSMYYSHHITCVEGGMICTDDENLYNIMLMCREHGWSRGINIEAQNSYKRAYNISDFNNLYTFYHMGLNVRNTDINAFLGNGQMDKLDSIVQKRNENFLLYDKLIKNDYWKPKPTENSFTSNLAYPIIHPKREEIVKALVEANVACRPLIAGALNKQPFYTDKYGKLELPNVEIVDKYGCYIPNNQDITKEDIEYICDIVNSIINE